MRLFLLGKAGSVNHWLEEATASLIAEGHTVRTGFVRRSWLAQGLEARLAAPIAAGLTRRLRHERFDLILVIGALHAPHALLEAVARLEGRPPLAGWAGDLFEAEAAERAALFDLIAYTDTALVARHQALGFSAPTLFLPHAADVSGVWPSRRHRSPDLVFVGNATPHRRAVVAGTASPLVLVGAGWSEADGAHHHRRARRMAPDAVRALYGGHGAVLNIRNEANVLAGLNQRNFAPLMAGAALLTDDQPDLDHCFEPGVEVLVWRDLAELNAQAERLRGDPDLARRLGERGRRRVLAEHTYGRRLQTLAAAL